MCACVFVYVNMWCVCMCVRMSVGGCIQWGMCGQRTSFPSGFPAALLGAYPGGQAFVAGAPTH